VSSPPSVRKRPPSSCGRCVRYLICSLAGVKVLMLAPPGGGKGTQGVRLAQELGVPHISSGDVLRREVAGDTELGREVEAHMAAGRLAPDELVTRAIRP